MKTIEKVTRDGDIQYFDIIESRKELKSWVKTLFYDSKYCDSPSGIWEDEDAAVNYYDKSGNYHGFYPGDEIKGLRISQIDRFVYSNCSSEMIYGNVPIVYSEDYGDWRTEL